MSEELTADQRAWRLKEAERHMRDYAARGVSNNAATVLLEEYGRLREIETAARVVRDWSVRSYGEDEVSLGGPLFALRSALDARD